MSLRKHSIKYSRYLFLIILIFFINSCPHPTIPEPVPITTSEPAPVSSQVKPEIRKLFKKISIKVENNAVPRINAERAILESLVYLNREFGPPPIQINKVAVYFNHDHADHAFTKIEKDNSRSIKIAAINTHHSQRHYLVHELFHALYQTQAILNLPESVYEAWAAYIHFRYKYQKFTNNKLRRKLIDSFRITSEELIGEHPLFLKKNIYLTPFAAQKKYALYLLPLTSVPHQQNKQFYSKLVHNPEILQEYTNDPTECCKKTIE